MEVYLNAIPLSTIRNMEFLSVLSAISSGFRYKDESREDKEECNPHPSKKNLTVRKILP